MNLFNFLLTIFHKKHPTGVLPDVRPINEKEKDWLHEEIAGAIPLTLVTKEEADKQKKYNVWNQNYTQSCVAHAITLLKHILTGFIGAPIFIYRQRSNYPNEGMIGEDSGNLLKNKGIPRFDTLPTPFNEAQANAIVITDAQYTEALNEKGHPRFTIQDTSYQNLASIVNSGMAIMIFQFSTVREWEQEWVDIKDSPTIGTAAVRHAISILPNTAFEYNGKRYVLIQDSAWFGNRYYRYVSEDFINKRAYFAQYITPKPVAPEIPKPHYHFTRTLTIGSKGEDVKALQEILKYEKCFDFPTSTGIFAGYTRAGVKKLQEKYASEILTPIGLTQGTGFVGISTLSWLNKNYSN